ncbi:glycerate kinase type-2 family protein [Thalassospira australica]|uniref:glycerate kinase type-2 family protein n=1 Tax=Thalassospira australica TaxID=1528106 RepID=UPI00051A4408|nr:glycerate kinase [Thalassospira australica]
MTDFHILKALFDSALDAAVPDGKFSRLRPPAPKGKTIVVGAGKAAAKMAAAFEDDWPNECQGLVVTRYGHRTPTRHIEVVEAAHPVPDQAGVDAARRIADLVSSATKDDLVICLISGGASALLSLPATGITLKEKQDINQALLRSGAPIDQMNTVRKSLSAIKGGRLAEMAFPAQLVTYLISDVPGDAPSAIGSGPTISESSNPEDALAILKRWDIPVSDRLKQAILQNPTKASSAPATVHMLATPMMSLEAASNKARSLGITPYVLGDAIEGEAREAGRILGGIVRSILMHDQPFTSPCVLLSGGETTVTVKGNGRGGRNAEFLLSLFETVGDEPRVAAIACDTDGIDGIEDNAGAWFDGTLKTLTRKRNLDAGSYLANNDAWTFFHQLDRLVHTGPTLTNVNDFRAILIK